MKSLPILFVILVLLTVGTVEAQFTIKDTFLEVTGVSNQGLVAGYEAQGGPYFIWNADAGTTAQIGGIAPGNGVGGQAGFSDEGDYLSGTSQGSVSAEMSRYDTHAQQWVPLGSLGFIVDNSMSGGYAISGDGNTVVGNSWADPLLSGGVFCTHAVAWSSAEGLMDLGSMFASTGRSARANAVSYDGSVVVGWQDFNGPWKSAVWRKNPSGGYLPNEYLLIDPNGNPNDEFNQLGECSAVSADGKWIGGYGDYANNYEPWIWSESTGVINLGTLAVGAQGYVTGMNADATVVVGWFSQGMWDPNIPFIWTPADGLMDLNTYFTNVLGFNLGTSRVYVPSRLSANGQFLAGWGIDESSFMFFSFRAKLFTVGMNHAKPTCQLNLYPNPAHQQVLIKNVGNAKFTLSTLEGSLLESKEVIGDCIFNLSGYKAGIYVVTQQTAKHTLTSKLVVY